MATPRLYSPEKLAPGSLIKLSDNAAIHASRALRMKVGDQAVLFNGDGNDYLCTLTFMSKSEVSAKIKSVLANHAESPLDITLIQAISSGDRMDFTIQKAVELGVNAIQPIASQRSVVKLTGDRAEKRREHWQNVVISACEQSGRAIVPPVKPASSLPQWLSLSKTAALRIILSPHATQSLHDIAKPSGEIQLLIGAEGGLTEDEINLASNHQFIPVRLGNRILRTETAALTAIAALQMQWGDFS
ncbi:MAG: 16S rRNA (uracil(1498)-N(3))-methyltransferase [Methylophilaceae bacterium]|nr:16S rRNA (uracil(1498)-N(3))-methyltransferase [Methylophilaceae bacterium]